MAEQEFTRDSLAGFDGKEGRPAYVAYQGKVYDVSESPAWEEGEHGGEHFAGNDLTDDMDYAPHLSDELERFPVVGALIEGSS